jgi:hypothetical protein
MAGIDADIERLSKLGIKDIDRAPVGAIRALSSLSDDDLKVIARAQAAAQAKGGKHADYGGLIY